MDFVRSIYSPMKVSMFAWRLFLVSGCEKFLNPTVPIMIIYAGLSDHALHWHGRSALTFMEMPVFVRPVEHHSEIYSQKALKPFGIVHMLIVCAHFPGYQNIVKNAMTLDFVMGPAK